MKLYYLRHSCSLAVHIALRETGQEFELVAANPRDKSELLKVNPKGQVPVLVLADGKVLTEAAAILSYVADQKPESGLIPPAGTWERYQCMEWLNYVSSELHKGFNAFFTYGKELDDAAKAVYRRALEKKYTWLNSHFEDHEYLMGSRYTVADIYAFVVFRWSKGAQIDLSHYTYIQRFVDQIGKRPQVVQAMEAEPKPRL